MNIVVITMNQTDQRNSHTPKIQARPSFSPSGLNQAWLTNAALYQAPFDNAR